MRHLTTLLGLTALTTAAAAPVTLTLNGQPTTLSTSVIGGVTYIKLADLQKALAAQGGANAKASVSGCLNEWLFNGIWRMRVTKVQPISDGGYGVTVEVKNGTTQTLKMNDAGIRYNNAINLIFADGNSWAKMSVTAWQDKTYAKLPQGTGTVFEFRIFPEDQNGAASAPTKFLFEVLNETSSDVKPRFTVADPSFRVDLTCRK
ncbi:hypothetical protein [Deinococcus sedimenti]|uniref:Uncharacterized protein n=1 Tax=Deinococcus sedimenti TaxID=1867090 RepID=A0ABQ2S1H2_9DEIO|nr:hypothetical protein [Deinococcus sedimenti]GGR79730.1 hypothetical protein GCM10008960_03240 [Deinococcus sedimenti]